MIPDERERMEYLCKRIAGEKNSREFARLAAELNDLVSVRIEHLCKRIKGEKNPQKFEQLTLELNDPSISHPKERSAAARAESVIEHRRLPLLALVNKCNGDFSTVRLVHFGRLSKNCFVLRRSSLLDMRTVFAISSGLLLIHSRKA